MLIPITSYYTNNMVSQNIVYSNFNIFNKN